MSTTTITTITPDDVKSWRHTDARFLMMLSGACGWSARLSGKGGHLHAENGTTMNIPDNTGLRMDVFRGWANKLFTHASRKPSAKTLFGLMEECKLDAAHRKMAWEASGLPIYQPPPVQSKAEPAPSAPTKAPTPPVPEEEPVTDRYRIMNKGKTVMTSDGLDIAVELARESLTTTSGPYTVVEIETGATQAILRYEGDDGVVRIMPYVSRTGNKTVVSPVVMERTWADGHVDYLCVTCDYSAETPRQVVAHQRAHADQSKWKPYESKRQKAERLAREAEEAAAAQKVDEPIDWRSRIVRDGTSEGLPVVNVIGTPPPPPTVEKPEMTANGSAEQKLRRIAMIAAPDLAREVEELRARAEAAEAKLAKFRELIGG